MSDDPTLQARVASLEAELRALRSELRTRRVVVVDDDGVERVVLSADRRTGSVLVRVSGARAQTVGLELYACEPTDEQPVMGLAELLDGDVVQDRLVPSELSAPPPTAR